MGAGVNCEGATYQGIAGEVSYVGESSRPLRERVFEHFQNLRNGSQKSFMIAHWMEAHETSLDAPEFKWQVLDSYGDALRRQLGEGLHILESGVLNRKFEFNNNIICRLQVTRSKDELTEEDLQRELESKRIFNNRMKTFIKKMSDLGHVIKKNKRKCSASEVNQMLYCRLDPFINKLGIAGTSKRKRRNMDTSTPVSLRRETPLLDLTDDSPIGKESSDTSSVYSASEDKIPDTKMKAGMSNELDSIAVTPPKDLSPDTMDKKLALHAIDLVKASVNNTRVLEMQEHELHTVDIADNPFGRREDKSQVVGMNEMNNGVNETAGAVIRAVGMDEMNKEHLGEAVDTAIRAVGMDEMNKTPIRGGHVRMKSDYLDELSGRKKIKPALRRFSQSLIDGRKFENIKDCRVMLGKGACNKILGGRAIPFGLSPKRNSDMEVDTATPAKRKKKERKCVDKVDSNQRLMTDIWCMNKSDANDKKQ